MFIPSPQLPSGRPPFSFQVQNPLLFLLLAGVLASSFFPHGRTGVAAVRLRAGLAARRIHDDDASGVAAFSRALRSGDDDEDSYTLVQYISDSTCMGARKVCLGLTKDVMVGVMHRSDAKKKVCTKLTQDSSTLKWHISSCYGDAEGSCPETCPCEEEGREPSQPYLLDECVGQMLGTGGVTSTKLMKGTPEDVGGCISDGFDVDGARHCSKWPVVDPHAERRGKRRKEVDSALSRVNPDTLEEEDEEDDE